MYYKVVGHDLSSSYIGSGFVLYSEELNVFYKLDQWVEPKKAGSKLMVFDSLENARKYNESWGKYIYMCEVKNPSKKGIFVHGTSIVCQNLDRILSLKKRKKKFSHLLNEPIEGTIFCDSVKLIGKPIV